MFFKPRSLSDLFLYSFFFLRVERLSFIGGKMRTAAWETAPQTALRDCTLFSYSYQDWGKVKEDQYMNKGMDGWLDG